MYSASECRECHILQIHRIYGQPQYAGVQCRISSQCLIKDRRVTVTPGRSHVGYCSRTIPTMSDSSLEQSCRLYEFIINTVIVGIFVVVGMIGNSLAFAVFWKGKFNKSTSFLFMCLSLTDSAVLLTAFVTTSIAYFVKYTGYMQGFGNAYPYIAVYVLPLQFVAQTATLWVTVLITVNRYIHVCVPLRASQWCTISKVKKQMTAVLLLAVLYTIPTFAESRIEHVMPNNTNNITLNSTTYIARVGYTRLWSAYGYYLIYHIVLCGIFIIILPTSILAMLNMCLVKALKTRRRMTMHNLHTQNESSMTIVLLIIVLVSIVCQFPALVTLVAWIVTSKDVFSCGGDLFYVMPVTNMLIVLNSSVNFIIYVICNKRFRGVMTEKLCKRCAPEQVVIAYEIAGEDTAKGGPANE